LVRRALTQYGPVEAYPDRMLKKLLKSAAHAAGYRVFREGLLEQYLPQTRDEYLSLYAEANIKANASSGLTHHDFAKERRFYTAYQMARHVLARGIPGDFAECGCRYGHSSYIIARTLAGHAPAGSRDFWIFDSFEGGLSDKVAQDRVGLGDTDEATTKAQKEHFKSSHSHVTQLFADFRNVRVVKGWIPAQTFVGECAHRKYAFAHIDVDLYEPTKASLDFFYDRMPEGSIIVVDDYGSSTFPGCKIAVDEFRRERDPTFFIESQLIGCVIVK
jgi:O-methyltransferase